MPTAPTLPGTGLGEMPASSGAVSAMSRSQRRYHQLGVR